MEQVRVRFAPSPTGLLHLGSVRTALFNFLFARSSHGKFILRIEDTDKERSSSVYEKDIIDGLKWMGLFWDEGPEIGGNFGPYYQSQRLQIYTEYVEKLKEKCLVYKCYCTDEELEEKRKKFLKHGIAPKYDGKCRNLSNKEIKELQDRGIPYTIRFKMSDKILKVRDLIRGEVIFDTKLIGDFIILKQDKTPTFLFANAIDDALMKINYVIRGEDHLSNMPRQIAIYQSLSFDIPKFAHISLMLAPDKSKLSKRHGAVALREYKEMGYLKEALFNYLLLLGYSPSKEIQTLQEICDEFSYEKFNKSGSIFDIKKLNSINNYYLKTKSIDEIVDLSLPYFKKEDIQNISSEKIKKIIDIAREGASTLKDIPLNSKIILNKILSYDKEKIIKLNNLKDILRILYKEMEEIKNFDADNILLFLKSFLKEKTVLPKELFHSIRLALTGEEKGPELNKIIHILGKEKTLTRLKLWL